MHSVDNEPPDHEPINLPRLVPDTTPVALHTNPILIVDSTECLIAAAQYLPLNWASAVGSAATTTYETYLGHSAAVIWGRNDEGGRTWGETMAETCAIPCHVVTLTSAPAHWHLADGLPPGRSAGQLQDFLAASCAMARVRFNGSHVPSFITDVDGIPEERGRPHSAAAQRVDVPAEFIRAGKGGVAKVFSNIVVLLRKNPDCWPLAYDQFGNRPFMNGEPLEDGDMRKIAEWCQHEGVPAGYSVAQEGIIRMAERAPFHPVKQYLESLTWDEKPRLSRMLSVLAGAEHDPTGLSDLLGRKWMIQAVARIYEPGCQADAMLVLEGAQGLGKSSMFRALFGDRWFTDHLPDLREKDSMLQLRGVWCVEVSELATLGRSDSAKIKQFLTSRVDRYRDPYGRLVADWPRTSVFAGTINPGAEGYLKDPTGGRRFWPVPITGTINIPAITENRDQLWAEARHAYAAHEPWHFTDEELARRGQVTDRQEARLEEDPWEPVIAQYLARRNQATAQEILSEAIHMSSTADWSAVEQRRVGRILTAMRWRRKRGQTTDGPTWVYYRTGEAQAPEQYAMDVDAEPDVEARR